MPMPLPQSHNWSVVLRVTDLNSTYHYITLPLHEEFEEVFPIVDTEATERALNTIQDLWPNLRQLKLMVNKTKESHHTYNDTAYRTVVYGSNSLTKTIDKNLSIKETMKAIDEALDPSFKPIGKGSDNNPNVTMIGGVKLEKEPGKGKIKLNFGYLLDVNTKMALRRLGFSPYYKLWYGPIETDMLRLESIIKESREAETLDEMVTRIKEISDNYTSRTAPKHILDEYNALVKQVNRLQGRSK